MAPMEDIKQKQKEYRHNWYLAHKEEQRAYTKAWREANPDKHREHDKKYRETHKSELLVKILAWRLANPDRTRDIDKRYRQRLKDSGKAKEKYRKDRLSTKYSITPSEWDTLFEKQERKCAICGSDDPNCSYGWHTDHDHVTNEVRGILCNGCNLLLGHAKDDIDRLCNAVTYLLDGGVPSRQ